MTLAYRPPYSQAQRDDDAPADQSRRAGAGPAVKFDVHAQARAERRALLLARVMAVTFSLGMAIIIARVVQLQVAPPPELARLQNTQKSTADLPGRRSNLTDRNGRVLASSRIAYRLFADPQLIEGVDDFAHHVSQAIGYERASDIDRKLAGRLDRRYVLLDERLTDEQLERAKQADIPGLAIAPVQVRDYPMGSLGGQIIGFVGRDGHGLEGAERQFESRLAGHMGRITFWRGRDRSPLWVEAARYTPPVDGRGIRLSIDANIQEMAENAIAQACEEYNAPRGELVVMDPYTGELLAMANWPTYDPAEFSHTDEATRRNRVVTDMYEPGSIFKPFIWAAALDQGIMKRGEKVDTTEAGYKIFNRRGLRDTRGHGEITVEDVLVFSSNIGMAELGLRLGVKGLFNAVRRFGFGETTGSQLPGETIGLVNAIDKWNPTYSVTSIPMGQEIAVTPIQLARAFAVFANGGRLVSPTIIAQDKTFHEREHTIVERIISPDVAMHTRQVMRDVVTRGTGTKANSKMYPIWGKTGTAQAPGIGGYLPDTYHSSFVCGAPLIQPRVIVVCVVHETTKEHGYYGGTVAAPAARKVVEQALQYLGVPSDQPVSPNSPASRTAM